MVGYLSLSGVLLFFGSVHLHSVPITKIYVICMHLFTNLWCRMCLPYFCCALIEVLSGFRIISGTGLAFVGQRSRIPTNYYSARSAQKV